MFNFALKKQTNKPAQESLVEKTPEIRDYVALNLSEGGRYVVITGTVRGIVSALAKLLRLRGEKPDAIAEKIKPFIASCVSAGDLRKDTAEYILSDDWYFTQSDYIPCYCRPSDSMWSLFNDILEEAKGSKYWNSDLKNDLKLNINPQEKAILDAFETARKAYYDAMRVRDDYFSKRGALIVHDVLRKYAQHISSIDEEFYKFMADQIAETLSQLDDDQSCPSDPSIKNELAVSRAGLTLSEQAEESDS
jgi:hypothetical protein